MKKIRGILALLLIFAMSLCLGCKKIPDEPIDSESESESESMPNDNAPGTLVTPPEGSTQYNVIFALATIPPVMAALDCIENGHETYVIIERGKTYNGIAALEKFHNTGFDPNDNLSQGFTATELGAMVDQVKALNESTENAFFNFFVQDGTALMAAAISANAGLTRDQFLVTMYEDGTGTYDALTNTYIKGKGVTDSSDNIYIGYAEKVAEVSALFDEIMAKNDNGVADTALRYNIGRAFALAALPNFKLVMQNETEVVSIIENASLLPRTKLLSVFGVEGYDDEVEYKANIEYKTISQMVSKLSEEQRTNYLTLMYGDFYADTFAALTRTMRADEAAPAKKLVFIGSRHSGYPKFASNAAYGIGGLAPPIRFRQATLSFPRDSRALCSLRASPIMTLSLRS